MIKLGQIHKSYRRGQIEVPVLHDVSLSIPAGQFVAIMGHSGSGKSTLLNIVGCLDVATQGVYSFDGKPLSSASEDDLNELRNRQFGFVFQVFHLLPRLTALQNVELPMIYARVAPMQRRQRAMDALSMVGLLHRVDHTPPQLSGGQQQRVAIARALVNRPRVIIADEPTGSLDSTSGNEIMEIFSGLHKEGVSVVMVTHEEEIAAYAERVIYLRDGQIEKDWLR